jgi:hypothetical protein
VALGRVWFRWHGTWQNMGGEMKGQQENGVGIQHASWRRSIASLAQYKCYQLTHTPRLPVIDRTVAPTESHGLVCFAERRTLVSACVPSNLNCTLPTLIVAGTKIVPSRSLPVNTVFPHGNKEQYSIDRQCAGKREAASQGKNWQQRTAVVSWGVSQLLDLKGTIFMPATLVSPPHITILS